ncbi:MAG: hypothetical protein ABMA26_26115 [Limisphaerales bacterium]
MLNAIGLHVCAGLVLFPIAVTALFLSHAYQFAAFCGIVLFVWAWRLAHRWFPSLLFLVYTVAFWLALFLPWRGFGQ